MPTATQTHQTHSKRVPGRRITDHQRELAVTDAQQATNYWEVKKAEEKTLQTHNQYLIESQKTKNTEIQLEGAKLDVQKTQLQNTGKRIVNRIEQTKNAGLVVDLGAAVDNVKFKVGDRTIKQLTYVEQLKSVDLNLGSLRQQNTDNRIEINQKGLLGPLENYQLNLVRPTKSKVDRLLQFAEAELNQRTVYAS
jgi:hypothetical protein